MTVIGDCFDRIVGVWEGRLSEKSLIASTLSDVPEMRQHTAGREQLAVIVKIESPRVCAALAENLKLAPGWMIAPDAAAKFLPLLLRCARRPNLRMVSHAVASIEPAIR